MVRSWINEIGTGEWIIDVGSHSTDIINEGKFTRRTTIDIIPLERKLYGVEQVVCDWMEYPFEKKADLVLCLQVLEHLPDDIVGPFARRLLEFGHHVIISVPYQWSEDQYKYHLQDPVDLDQLVVWTGALPIKHHIESRDKKKRLIALFKGK